MNDKENAIQNQAQIEEMFMNAASGDSSSVKKLTSILRDAGAGAGAGVLTGQTAEVLDSWASGAALFLETLPTKNADADELELACMLARAGVDSQLLRDALAVAARKQFAAWPDPAGLLKGLGVYDLSIPALEVMRGWDFFSVLEPNLFCWCHAHGAGVVEEIDGITSELRLRFARIERFELDVFLKTAAVVLAKSWFADILNGKKKWPGGKSGENETDALIKQSLVPLRGDWKIMVDDLIAKAGLEESIKKASAVAESAKKAAKTPAANVAANIPDPGDSRPWWEARSIQELVEILRREDATLSTVPENLDEFIKLWQDICGRKDLMLPFCEALARIWKVHSQNEWFRNLLLQCKDQTSCWQDQEFMVELTVKLPGRFVQDIFSASQATMGSEWLIEVCLLLPLRLWLSVEKVLAEAGVDADDLVKGAVAKVAKGEASADVLMWLWRSKAPAKEVMAQPTALFRVLAKPVKGAYLKASRDLRKILLEDESFQRFMMAEGEEAAVGSMIRCIRHLPVLDKGEQQSLLVKIVRLYPHFKHLVEHKTVAVKRRPIGKITSVRSFELFRRELNDIINKKIPENSRAIAHARSYGDLRENAEFKAAKEQQRYLNARRGELETGLNQVQQVDFSQVVPENGIVPGCTVVVKNTDSGQEQTFHVLGLWDSNPELGILSYETELGKVLIGCEVGETLDSPIGKLTITEIRKLSEELQNWTLGEDLA